MVIVCAQQGIPGMLSLLPQKYDMPTPTLEVHCQACKAQTLCKHSPPSHKGLQADLSRLRLCLLKSVNFSFLFFSATKMTIVATFAGVTEQAGPPQLPLCGQHL